LDVAITEDVLAHRDSVKLGNVIRSAEERLRFRVLPGSATDPFNLVATGDTSIEADGKGNFVSGAWEHRRGPPKSPIRSRLKLKPET
jgi:hypothetical protein